MKKNAYFLLSLSLFICASVSAQVKTPIKKIHAYKQENIPGIRPVEFDEKGNRLQKERRPTYNYWFYIEIPAKEKITVADLWISGKRYSAKNETLNKTPVQKIIYSASGGPDTAILVSKTINKVILTYPSGQLKDSVIGSRYISNLIRNSELVIGYYWKGKKYFAAVKSLVNLEPDAHQ